jgi:hypothetical protein
MDQLVFNLPNLIYWLALVPIIYWEACVFGPLWKKKEAARWTMGYFTVFALAVPLVAAGYWDINTWTGLFFGVGLSGIIKLGWEQIRKSQSAERLHKSSPWLHWLSFKSRNLSDFWQDDTEENERS